MTADAAACTTSCEATCDDQTTSHTAVGEGTATSPYLICTAAQFVSIGEHADDWHAYYRLTQDIDLSGYSATTYSIIGNTTRPFTGQFDGGGHVIANFHYADSGATHVGLFGAVLGPDSAIYDVRLTNIVVVGLDDVGGLAGWVYQGRIHNVVVNGQLQGTNRAGGLVGLAEYAAISNSGALVDIQATGSGREIGGLIGSSRYTATHHAFARGEILDTDGASEYIGGLHGRHHYGYVSDSFAAIDVSGEDRVGAFIGHFVGSVVQNSYATGSATSGTANARVSRFIASTGGTNSGANNYYNSAASCTAPPPTVCNTAPLGPTPVDLGAQPTYFHSDIEPRNEPLRAWDFAESWTVQAQEHPWPAPGGVSALCSDCDALVANAPFAGGSGRPDDPYLICSAEQFHAIGQNSSLWTQRLHFSLCRDIDLADYADRITPIGNATTPFHGSLNGRGHRISGFAYNAPDRDDVGLFGYFEHGYIRHLGVEGALVTGRNRVGVLVGHARADTYLLDVYATGAVTGQTTIGGLIGRNASGDIRHAYAQVDVSGASELGGLVGDGRGGPIFAAFALGSVSGSTSIDVGRVEGRGSGTLSDVYFNSGSPCTGCTTESGIGIDLATTPNWFSDPANPPLTHWNFTNLWTDGNTLPQH